MRLWPGRCATGQVLGIAAAVCLVVACGGEEDAASSGRGDGVAADATRRATPRPAPTRVFSGAAVVTIDSAPYASGDARVDALIAAIESHDVEALLAAWEARPVPCGPSQQLPACPAGVRDGTEIDLFPTMVCGPGWVTARSDVRASIEAALAGSARSALYSVERLPPYMGRPPSSGYVDRRETLLIITTPGSAPSPYAPATTWNATQAGTIKGASPPCAREVPAAFTAEISGGYGTPDWVVPPRATCATGDVRVDVEIWRNHSNDREMFGTTLLADGSAGGATEIIKVRPGGQELSSGGAGATQWHGGLRTRDDVYPGIRVTAEGKRLDNCIIDALDVTKIDVAAPNPSTPRPQSNAPPIARGQALVSAGNAHSCAVRGGALWCWGKNRDGQLGIGSRTDSVVPVLVTSMSSGVTAVSAGDSHTCAINDGAVWCWGSHDFGVPWLDGHEPSLVAVPVPGLERGVTAITAARAHSCAIKDGGAWCWGENWQGQLGTGGPATPGEPTPASVAGMASGVSEIHAGDFFTCAIKDGGAWCWGTNLNGVSPRENFLPVAVPGMESGVSSMTAGTWHACAIKNGAAWCWGTNGDGQVGNVLLDSVFTPLLVDGAESGVSAVTAGGFHTCAIIDGGAKCWGFNYDGQLGNGTLTGSRVPVAVTSLSSGVTGISAGSSHVCALTDAGVQCWGVSLGDETGVGSAERVSAPVVVLP